MTIGLSYLSDLSRVRVALSSLARDGTVKVEHSFNQLLWDTVRGGVALPVVSGAAQLDDYDGWGDSVANYYRVTPVDPPAGLLLTGATGDGASTPDTAVLDITGDLDVRVDASLAWDEGSGFQYLLTKYTTTGNQRGYALRLNTGTFALQLAWSPDGTAVQSATATEELEPDPDTNRLAVRATLDVDNGASGHTVTFYTAASMEGPWTQLGDSVVGVGTTSIFSNTADLWVNGINGGTSSPVDNPGTVYAAEVRSGIGGTAVADVSFAAQDDGDTSFVDDAGRTWTVQGAAHIVGALLETANITPDLGGQVWLKCPRFPFLNRPITVTGVSPIGRVSRGMAGEVTGRSMPVGTVDIRGSRAFTLTVFTDTNELAGDMDLILATGEIMFVHVPTGSTVPGGYVMIGDTAQAPGAEGGGSPEQTFELPCRVVVAPGADVVGTTMVWGTVFALYGSWGALIASNPSWSPLLATVGSAEDVVVL